MAARRLRRALSGHGLSIVTVSLVVGAGSGVLSVANATLLRPLPLVDGDRLAQIFMLPPDLKDRSLANPMHALAFVRFQELLTLAEGQSGAWARERALGGDGDPESIEAAEVSAGFFEVLGVKPVLGRTFSPDEDRDGAALVVLGHALWQRRFGADPAVLGRSLDLDGVSHRILGVMPAGFEPAFVPSQAWTPLGVHRGMLRRESATYITSVVRMRAGVTVHQLDAEVRSVATRIAAEASAQFRGWTAGARTLRDARYGAQRTATVLLLLAVGALALIAAANLAHLTLTRAIGRRAETAVRMALGARAVDLIRDEAASAALVAVTGGVIGLGLSQWTLPALLSLDPSPSLPRDAAALDWRVAAGTFGFALVVTLTGAIWPVAREARRDPRRTLIQRGHRVAGDGSRVLRLTLISLEAAVACVLVSSSLLLLAGFRHSTRIDPGFDPDRLLGAQLRLGEQRYTSVDARGLMMSQVLDALRATPGVVSAATTMNRFVPGFTFVTLAAPGDPPPPDAPRHTVQFRRVSDGYFDTMRIPLLAGRAITTEDTRRSMPVAVVSRRLADRFWPDADAVGQRLQRRTPGTPVMTVIGVVGDVSDVSLGEAPQPMLYVPYRQENNTNTPLSLVVRTAGPPDESVRAVHEAVYRVDPTQPVSGITTLTRFLHASMGPARFRSTLLGAFAALGLLFAGVGIYGVTARSVAERTHEAGIRLALGATPTRVWWTVASAVLVALIVGVAGGLVLGWAASRALVSAWPEVAGASARGAAWVALAVLTVIGGIAAVVPARRAARVDPLIAIRGDHGASSWSL